ncbi:unnamed protein product [Didymodactylos carnosus]|uniref:Uncharacterized protein n=1 Tax=Didymodactylos carnosus TaxID=1234261 RepID=A0A814VRC6_9BILA|nr:unnamed protein product [Didymodactylos carnosus]CAF3956092.1 unnamed protein product [Didymodactylos carnosus]
MPDRALIHLTRAFKLRVILFSSEHPAGESLYYIGKARAVNKSFKEALKCLADALFIFETKLSPECRQAEDTLAEIRTVEEAMLSHP